MINILFIFSLALVFNPLLARELKLDASELNIKAKEKLLICPVPSVVNGKDVLVQPVKLTPLSQKHQLFKVEPLCAGNGENEDEDEVGDEDKDEDENEENEEDEKEKSEAPVNPKDTDVPVVLKKIDEFVDDELLGGLFRSSKPSLNSNDGADVEEDDPIAITDPIEHQVKGWVVRPYGGFVLDNPLLVAADVGVYIEDASTTNGFVFQFAPGLDGYKFGAGVSTGFVPNSDFRVSLLFNIGQDGEYDELPHGESFWEDFHDASTFIGVSLRGQIVGPMNEDYPNMIFGVGYGTYIDGDQYEDAESSDGRDFIMLQIGFGFN